MDTAENVLLERLGSDRFTKSWKRPVEDQNHDDPPKRIVEALFSNAGKRYRDTADVPWILERSDCQEIEERCPQRFAPFLKDLLRILA